MDGPWPGVIGSSGYSARDVMAQYTKLEQFMPSALALEPSSVRGEGVPGFVEWLEARGANLRERWLTAPV